MLLKAARAAFRSARKRVYARFSFWRYCVTDKSHLEEFTKSVSETLSKKLAATFVDCHRDPSLTETDVTTLLKEQMEAALIGDRDAAS